MQGSPFSLNLTWIISNSYNHTYAKTTSALPDADITQLAQLLPLKSYKLKAVKN